MQALVENRAARAELLLRAYAHEKSRYAGELGERRLIVPDSRDFPDKFVADEDSAARLLRRMQGYAGLSDVPLGLRVTEDDERATSSCSGACAVPEAPSTHDLARVVDEGDGWTLLVSPPELRHPIYLTTQLARSLALVFLLETERPGDPGPTPLTLEVAAVQLGFGGLLLQGSHVYQKSCAGPRVDRFTALDVNETALLCALMGLDTGAGLGRLPRVLEATQQAALSEATEFLKRYQRFLEQLRQQPALAATSPLRAEEPGGLLSSLKRRLGGGTKEATGDDLEAWQKALEAGHPPNKKDTTRALPSQDLRDLVKSEL